MTRQLRSYHSLVTLTGVVFAMTLSGCGARETNATDTKTNWLLACDEDSDCNGSLTCLCGVCSATCDATSDCAKFDGDARCLDVSHCGAIDAVCAMSKDDLNPPHDDTGGEAGTPTSSSSAGSSIATSVSSADSSSDPTTGSASATTENDGTSSGSNSTSSCRDEGLYITLGETCRVDFNCAPDLVPFFDDCGCGCEPVMDVDGGAASFCPPPPPEGTSVHVTVLAETTCFGDTLSQMVTSQEALDAALAYCEIVIDQVSFDGNVVYIGVFPERTTARFNYAVQTDGTIYLGLESDVYCGGAAPPDAVVVLQFNDIGGNTPVFEDLCTLGECSGLPVP